MKVPISSLAIRIAADLELETLVLVACSRHLSMAKHAKPR